MIVFLKWKQKKLKNGLPSCSKREKMLCFQKRKWIKIDVCIYLISLILFKLSKQTNSERDKTKI